MAVDGIGSGISPEALERIYARETEALAGKVEQEQEQDPVNAAAGSVWTLNLSTNGGQIDKADLSAEVESELGENGQGMLGSIVQNIMNFFGNENQEQQGTNQSLNTGTENKQQNEVTMNVQPTEGQKLDIETA